MLLSLFKLTMIVSLLISAVCVETDEKTASEKDSASAVSSARQDEFLKEEKKPVDGHDEDSPVQKRQSSKHAKYTDDQDPRTRRGSVRSTEHKALRSVDSDLANKMAKEALKSGKMQDTMRKLTRLSKPRDPLYASVKLSSPTKSKKTRNEHKHDARKVHRKSKGKRHHRKYRNGHAGWSRRGSSKSTSSASENVNASAGKATGTEHLKDKPSASNEKVTRVQVEEGDYVDTPTPSIKSPRDNAGKRHMGERMIDSLMRTTTRDPSKRKLGDQGIEYSDYYSDNEVLQDLAANKIPTQLTESKNPGDRFARRASRSLRVDRKVPSHRRNRPRRWQKFQKRFAARKSRFLGSDDSAPNYIPKYQLVDDPYDHLDPMYPVSGQEVLDQSLTPEQDSLNARGGFSDEIQQQNPYDYSNQEIQQPESNAQDYQPVDTSVQVENFDQNTVNQPQVENAKEPNMMEDAEVPSYPDEEAMKNIQAQGTNDLPQSYANNAMSQPLGKVLQSLGISVSVEPNSSSQNTNLENASPATNDQLPSDNFEERILSPSYLKPEAKEETNSGKWSSRRTAQSRNVNKDGHSRRQSNAVDTEYSPYTDDPLAPPNNMNISIAMQDTKEIANQILSTIMEELEVLKSDRAKNNARDGSWSSARTGMKLDMKVLNRSIVVKVFELTTIQFRASPLNGTWNVSGYAPFKRGAPFTLIATDNTTKSVAVFVGACKVCEGIDMISGVWSVAHQPKDCKDFQVSTTVFNDVFRKTTLSTLRENQNAAKLQNAAKHQNTGKLQNTSKAQNTTLKHDKRKS